MLALIAVFCVAGVSEASATQACQLVSDTRAIPYYGFLGIIVNVPSTRRFYYKVPYRIHHQIYAKDPPEVSIERKRSRHFEGRNVWFRGWTANSAEDYWILAAERLGTRYPVRHIRPGSCFYIGEVRTPRYR
jgi:hypothetical protein